MSTRLERRVISTEFRVVKNGNKATRLVGYGAVFNSDSEDLGGFTERIAPGAFDGVLAAGPDVRALFNHEPSAILGRTTAGTLTLTTDSVGLRYDVEVPDTTVGRDLLVSASRGDITQSSFGFRVADDGEEWYDTNGRRVDDWYGVKRVIRKISELFDVSPVTYPAYTSSSVEARSRFLFPEGRPGSTRNVEDARREALRNLVHLRNTEAVRDLVRVRKMEVSRDLAQHEINRIRETL